MSSGQESFHSSSFNSASLSRQPSPKKLVVEVEVPKVPKPIENRQLLLPLPPKDGNFVLHELQRVEVVHKEFWKSYLSPRRIGRIVNGYRKMENDFQELDRRKPKQLAIFPNGPVKHYWKFNIKMPETTAHEIGWLSGLPQCSLELFGLDKKYNTKNLNLYQLGHHYTQQW